MAIDNRRLPGLFGMFIAVMTVSCSQISQAASEQDPYTVENKWFKFRLTTRTPEQMAGFYEGRGFSKAAIARITQYCFITVGMRNQSNEVIWLDLSTWSFATEFAPIQRITREQWQQHWREIDLPMSHQSTFGWTLLPESRNLQPSEPVGGNITLPLLDEPFTFTAEFYLGADREGGKIGIRLENVQCKRS